MNSRGRREGPVVNPNDIVLGKGQRRAVSAEVGPRLHAIQYLRGAAALAVCAYHALQWCDGGFDVGRAGVDVFFVISGVIMWRISSTQEPLAGQFLWRRFSRVAPLYWIATLLVAAIAPIWPGFLPEVRPGVAHLLLSLAFIPHLDPRGLPFPTLPPGWTLDYEMIFYLIVAAALALGLRRVSVVCGALLTIVALGFIFPDSAYFLGANPMLLQFAAGIALAEAAMKGRLRDRALGLGLISGALLIWALVQLGGLFSELWRPLVWGVPATLLVAGALCLEGRTGQPPLAGFPHRILTLLGDASYSIYLFHLPATAIVAHNLGYRDEAPFFIVSMAVSISIGLLVHSMIERPLLARLRGLQISKAAARSRT